MLSDGEYNLLTYLGMELIEQMKKKILKEIKKYDERRKKGMENSLEKKEYKNKKSQKIFVYFFPSNLARFK